MRVKSEEGQDTAQKNQKNSNMSKKIKKKWVRIEPDPLYESEQVSKFINHIMKKGKKALARKILYGALELIKEEGKKDPIEVFNLALENAGPLTEVRPRRIGGATYQVPLRVRPERKESLAIRWLIGAAKSKKGKSMSEKLAQELVDAAENKGEAVKKKRDTHRMAEANRAFAHFAW